MSIRDFIVPAKTTGSWRFIEVDFTQLEVYGLAILSGCTKLLDDLSSGKDLHRQRASELFNVPLTDVTDEQRRAAKSLSFMLQYGAQPPSMSEKLGLLESICQQFIDNFYKAYPEIMDYHTYLVDQVDSNYRTYGEALYTSGTGRTYSIPVKESTSGKKYPSRTAIKNYPVQGFSTADIVPLALGDVFRAVVIDPSMVGQVKLCMTTHDSITLRLPDSLEEPAIRLVSEVLDKLPSRVYDIWGMDIPHLPYEWKSGKNLGSLHKVTLEKK